MTGTADPLRLAALGTSPKGGRLEMCGDAAHSLAPPLGELASGFAWRLRGQSTIHRSRLSLLMVSFVPTVWKIWTMTISRMTATSMVRYL